MRNNLIILFVLVFINTNAQVNKQSAFTFTYNYQIPIGELSAEFGNNSAVGTSYFFEKSNNIFYGIEANYLFGGDVKDSTLFDNITTSTGAIIASDGRYGNVNLMERGLDAYLFAGYAFHLDNNNLSGLYLSQGIGYLQHQIFIDTKNQNIPQLNEDMKKGYDRFTNGISTKLSADYKYYSKKGMFHMSAGINYTMAYTKIQRTYDFAKDKYYSTQKKWDRLIGFKVEVIIPILRKNDEEFHYF